MEKFFRLFASFIIIIGIVGAVLLLRDLIKPSDVLALSATLVTALFLWLQFRQTQKKIGNSLLNLIDMRIDRDKSYISFKYDSNVQDIIHFDIKIYYILKNKMKDHLKDIYIDSLYKNSIIQDGIKSEDYYPVIMPEDVRRYRFGTMILQHTDHETFDILSKYFDKKSDDIELLFICTKKFLSKPIHLNLQYKDILNRKYILKSQYKLILSKSNISKRNQSGISEITIENIESKYTEFFLSIDGKEIINSKEINLQGNAE